MKLHNRSFFILYQLGAAFIIMSWVNGQGASTYPYVSPTASASGMTSGLENGATAATMNMMQVRAAAQDSQRAAAAAAMARSANTAIEEQGLNKALEKARLKRLHKIDAAERLKWQQLNAQNAYNKVSESDMKSWKDQSGNVKIGQNLPAEFVQSLQREEAARAANAPKEKKSFAPLKKLSERVNEAVGVEPPISGTGLQAPKPLPPAPVEDTKPERKFSFKAPKLFRKRQDTATVPVNDQVFSAAPGQITSQTVAASASIPAVSVAKPAPRPAPKPKPAPSKPKPVTITQSRSGMNLINQGQAPAAQAPKKTLGNLFSRSKSSNSPSTPKPASKFSFGKKKSQQAPAPVVSSGLFPTGAIPNQAASTGNSTPIPVPQRQVALPGASSPPKKRFSFPKPKLSIPKAGGKASGDVSPTSITNRNGNNFYVVNGVSQFMKYGNSQSDTTISALQPGTVVMMTKPGASWATVRLRDGSSGVVQTKFLKGAAQSASGFAPAQSNYVTEMQKQVTRN